MELKVLGQPYRDSASGASFLGAALGDPDVRRLIVATAWVRESGMQALIPGLEALRARGGRSTMVLGVDLRGTTRQGLDLARRHFDRLFVVHDPEGRTFHPKLYLALGPRRGYALIGSNNLTAGGLGFNYEAAVECVFDPRRENNLAEGIEKFVRQVIADGDICKEVTPSTVKRLIHQGWLADEESDRRNRSEDRTRRAKTTRGRQVLFTRSRVAKRTTIPPRRSQDGRAGATGRTQARTATAPDTWWKQLGAGDAQHPAYGHPTGVVRLTPPLDQPNRERFFRRVFFAQARWRAARDANNNRIELAQILADVEIDDRSVGRFTFTVDYGAYRNQRGRATTVMHWGDLMRRLRRRDLTNWYLLIERGQGVYRVRILRRRPG